MTSKQEIERIARGLSKAQREALTHKDAGGTSYRWAKINTLEALRSRSLVGYNTGPGAFFSPQTAIEWPLTPTGLAVRAYLQEQGE